MAKPGVGPTGELSLRASVATLARLLLQDANGEATLLALEHKAWARTGDGEAWGQLQAQPFGGGVRLLKPQRLLDALGSFNYDSPRSRDEADLRLFIRPSDWPELLTFCRREFSRTQGAAIEAEPLRELQEELVGALGIHLEPDQVAMNQLGLVVQGQPVPTHNRRAPDQPTARLYGVFEVSVEDPGLHRAILDASERQSAEALRLAALKSARAGGRGRANGILVTPLDEIQAAYRAASPAVRDDPLPFAGTVLGGNVPAVVPGIAVPKLEFRASG